MKGDESHRTDDDPNVLRLERLEAENARLRAERAFLISQCDELRAVLRSYAEEASATAEQFWETAKRFRTAVEYKVDGMLLGDNEAARAALACRIVADLISRSEGGK